MNAAELLAQTEALIAAASERVLPEEPERSHAETILARYDEVDEKLVAAGFPATSAWWRGTFQRWYDSGKRQLVPRVGRRGGKSSSLSRLAVVEALYGKHVVPPGDIPTVAIISTDKSEALGRLETIKAILDALGVAYRPCAAPKLGIRLVESGVEFRIFTASIAGVSGFTAIFILCDEVAKWRDKDTGANPATQVLSSVRPTMATQPNARIVLSSSPMGRLDAHYDAHHLGETDLQVTAYAPTWEANPTVSEADTRALEPDVATWEREYKAVPQSGTESSLLTEYLVQRMTRALAGNMPRHSGHFYVATMDPATRGHAWTLAVSTLGFDGKKRVVLHREWRGSKAKPLDPKEVLKEIADEIRPYGITMVHTDQWSVDSLKSNARDAKLVLKEVPWTPGSKAEAYENLLKLAQADQVETPPDAHVQSDLLGIIRKLTRNGVTYELVEAQGRHSDFAPTIAMGFMLTTIPAKKPTSAWTEEERDEHERAKFLEDLTRDKKRTERIGRLPPSHQFRRGRHGY